MKIFIYGVPGSGKTTLAQSISSELGVIHLELDHVRSLAQSGNTEEHNPYLFVTTTEAWRYINASLTKESAVNGLLQVRSALSPYVKDRLNQHSAYVAESTFIDPIYWKTLGQAYLIVTPDIDQHRDQFFMHRHMGKKEQQQFVCARYLNDYLHDEARTLEVPVLLNTGDITKLVRRVVTEAT